MKSALFLGIGVICGIVLMALPKALAHVHHALHGGGEQSPAGQERLHTQETFSFIANAPMETVFPLFGAERERVWASHWNPQFVYPLPAADREGMVFTVAHDHLHAAWVNTLFDAKNGRIQYVYVIPDALITVIHLKLTPDGQKTRVDVQYDRTALSPDADAHVKHMADGDRKAGPEWEQQLNSYLAQQAANGK